jgi:hypothetical protein
MKDVWLAKCIPKQFFSVAIMIMGEGTGFRTAFRGGSNLTR